MKKALPLLVICVLLMYTNAFSQTDRIPGYIVTVNGDTVRGFVIDRKDDWSVKEIQFARTETEMPTTYKISGLDAIYLKTYDAYYLSRELGVDKKSVTHLEDNGKRQIVTERILLHLLSKGVLNLYGYTDENKKVHFYIQKGNGQIEELPYVVYLTNGAMAVMRYYQGTLKDLTQDCKGMKTPPDKYEEKELTEYVRRYNSCVGDKGAYVSQGQKTNFRLGLIAGAGFFSGKFSGKAPTTFPTGESALGKYSSVTSPMLGVFVEVASGRRSSPSRPGLQIAWRNIPTSTRTETIGPNVSTYKLTFTTINIGPTYKYMFTTGNKFNPYFRAEIGAALVQKGEGIHIRAGSTTVVRSLGNFNRLGYSYAGGVGVSLKQFNVDVLYRGSEFSTDIGGRVTFSGVEAALSWVFTKD